MTKLNYFKQPNKRFFFGSTDAVCAYINENCREQKEKTIAIADDVAAQRFQFNLRWDMEKTWTPVIFDGEIDWLYQPGGDPEWIFAFNRMRFWICLGQAYALTGDEKYAEAFARQLCHWIKNIRPDDPACEKAWRSIEVGLRLEYWLKAMCYFEGSPAVTDEIIELFAGSVAEHAEFIMGVWNSYNLMSNWGVLANHGLFLAGAVLPETPRSKEYLTEAIRRLELEIRMQVYRDGTHWEQSSMYHNEVLHCYLDVVLLAQRNGISLPESILRKTRDMCYADALSAKPDHNEVSMGDSDDIDQRDMISRGALLFRDATLKSRGFERPDFETAWEIGDTGISEYPAIPSELPDQTDKAFVNSGNFYFRSSWDENATFLHFHCGTLGAGHGHADQLHFDLFSRGEDIFIDSGRFTYTFDGGRSEFKELRAHNTLMVDKKDIYVCKDSWECHDLARPVNQKFYSFERYGYTEGGHLAYMKTVGVFVNRRIIYLKPDIVVIADEFYTAGKHQYNQFYHFNNIGELKCSDKRCIYKSEKLRAEIDFSTTELSMTTGSSHMSRHYNQSVTNPLLTTEFTGDGFMSAFTVIGVSDPEDTAVLSVKKMPVYSNFKEIIFRDDQVEALDILFGQYHYTLVIAHEEFASPTDTFLADGCTGFGNCVAFDRTANEEEIGTVLIW